MSGDTSDGHNGGTATGMEWADATELLSLLQHPGQPLAQRTNPNGVGASAQLPVYIHNHPGSQ